MRLAAVALLLMAVAACSGSGSGRAARERVYDPLALPRGPVGTSIAYGRLLIVDTRHVMKDNVTARLNCSACHIDGGLKERGGSFIGVYSQFPQWNKRARRVITLQDRLAECFLYSMNGRPPSFASREMIAMVAYIAWLSRGTPAFSKPNPADKFVEPLPPSPPDLERGAGTYARVCSQCHQSDGNGLGDAIPPLWGPHSFNDRAGMAHLDRMTGFVRYNMPEGAPGSLSLREAYDVSAFVLSHRRPKFRGGALVVQSVKPAAYF
ncbi:MAG TPA: c-type cytochrome [Candidatus Acidoferrales bacterium]|nr:c-type cytochrome [Candidatus Acidoferrales bacterium]